MSVRGGCGRRDQVRTVVRQDLRLGEAGEDEVALCSILGIGIGIFEVVSSCFQITMAFSAYRLAGSCLFRPWDLFIGSYAFTASEGSSVELNADCDSRSSRSSDAS